MSIVSVEHLGKSFGDLQVLKDISLQVDNGEVVSIIGPSGSGKSTLLRCLNRLETVDTGTVTIDGDVMVTDINGKGQYADKETLKRIRLHTGLVFQNFNLFPHLSVLQNITEAPIHVLGKKEEDAKKEAMELLARLGLEEKAAAYPGQLSGGQSQRVSIARALALQPKVLFFDEPTSALDPALTGEVLKVIRSLADLHMTMIIVTHEMEFARDISDRMIYMDGGVIVEDATPEEMFRSTNPKTIEFLGSYHGV